MASSEAATPRPPDFNVVFWRHGVFLSCKINARICFRPRTSPFAFGTDPPGARLVKPTLKSGGEGGRRPLEKCSRSCRAFILQTPDPVGASDKTQRCVLILEERGHSSGRTGRKTERASTTAHSIGRSGKERRRRLNHGTQTESPGLDTTAFERKDEGLADMTKEGQRDC